MGTDTRRIPGYSIKDVFVFASKYWWSQPCRFTAILTIAALATFIMTNLPNALSALFESIRMHSSAENVWFHFGVFFAVSFGAAMLFNINFFNYIIFENNIFKKLLNDAFAQVEGLSEQYFVNTFTGSMIAAITRGKNSLRTFEDTMIWVLIPTGLAVVYSVILLALRLPLLAACLAVYLVVIISASFTLVAKYSGPAQARYADAQDRFGGHLADCLTGIFTTKSYAQESREIERFAAENDTMCDFYLNAQMRGAQTILIQRAMIIGMQAVLIGGGTWSYLIGKASIDDMAYLVMAYWILQAYVQNIGDSVKNFLTSSYDIHGLIALMKEQQSVADKENAVELVASKGEVCFKGVGFTYPDKDKPVFKDLSVTIRPGERLALVGDSGGGKTSFVRLIQRLYDAQEGEITIDGQSITDVTQVSLRRAIAVVPQDPILFHRSIAENIAYGRPDSTLEEIRQAAKQADIDDFVMALPKQYETLVGERGVKLSGGERQRVAIARAILSDRKILILDEATSSLDSVSELAVQKAIQTVAHGRTAIIIAHRLSTIRDADRILVFKDGQIVEEGTHTELCRKANGVYASFLAIQTGSYVASTSNQVVGSNV